jgi:antitoxin ParD1/3/4
MATNVHLTPELERFARRCVEQGRYNNVSEVVRQALRLLQEAEDFRRRFKIMLRATEREADREGTFTTKRVLAEADAVIGARRR